ncbi:hypothetical protein FQN57_003525 [Myotisia sp. PD_48]|nr:hypothetical protein FQN57_003525 [Myotisia sp. PD_48]
MKTSFLIKSFPVLAFTANNKIQAFTWGSVKSPFATGVSRQRIHIFGYLPSRLNCHAEKFNILETGNGPDHKIYIDSTERTDTQWEKPPGGADVNGLYVVGTWVGRNNATGEDSFMGCASFREAFGLQMYAATKYIKAPVGGGSSAPCARSELLGATYLD